MALYGQMRDISMFRFVNRELMQKIISQQVVFYKYKVGETKVNMYGEAAGSRYYYEPVILNALIARSDQEFPQDDLVGVDFQWGVDFRFFRDDLVDAQVVPEVGDIVMYYERYYEVHTTNANQYFVGKNPDYPYDENPLNPGLDQFGYNVEVRCDCHYVPSDRLNIIKSRM